MAMNAPASGRDWTEPANVGRILCNEIRELLAEAARLRCGSNGEVWIIWMGVVQIVALGGLIILYEFI